MATDIPGERVGTFARDTMLIPHLIRTPSTEMDGSSSRVVGGRGSERHHE